MLSVIAAPPTFLDDQVRPRYPPAGKAFVRTGIFGWNFPGHASGVGGPDRGQGRGYRLGSPPAPADREDRGAPTGLTAGLPILGPGLTMGVGQAEHRGDDGDRARDGWRLPSPRRGGRGHAVPAAALPGRAG